MGALLSREMKIALCLEYPLALKGGVSVLVETLLGEFVRRGHSLVLVSDDDSQMISNTGVGKLIAGHFRWDRQNVSIQASRNLARQLVEAKVQIAHFHFGGNYGFGNRFPLHSPIIYLDRFGVPCFSTAHLVVDLFNGYCGPQKPFWFKALMLPLAWTGKMQQLYHTQREVTVSQHDFEKLIRWYWPLRNRFVHIYHSRLQPQPVVMPQSVREKVILNVGHIAWRKGQMVLAKAFAQIAGRHPGWILQFAGDEDEGVEAEKIRQLIKDENLGTRIQLLGDRDDVFQRMQRASIYIQPSYWEGLPLSLQEAMFCGCAAIASRIGGHKELISDGKTGSLFEPGNISELATALDGLIDNEACRERFAIDAAASIRTRGMTANEMAEHYLELYNRVAHDMRDLPT